MPVRRAFANGLSMISPLARSNLNVVLRRWAMTPRFITWHITPAFSNGEWAFSSPRMALKKLM